MKLLQQKILMEYIIGEGKVSRSNTAGFMKQILCEEPVLHVILQNQSRVPEIARGERYHEWRTDLYGFFFPHWFSLGLRE
jgi:hypothetical protein